MFKTLPSYLEVVKAIRETIFDVNPVEAFNIAKQDFLVSIQKSYILTKGDTDTYDMYNLYDIYGGIIEYSSNPKLYDIVNKFKDLGITVKLGSGYIANEVSTSLKQTDTYVSISNPYRVMRSNYFSDEAINTVILDFFLRYLDLTIECDLEQEAQSMIETYLCKVDIQRLVIWVAYFLLEKRRMSQASLDFLRIQNEEDDIDADSCDDVRNVDSKITTRIDNTFTISEETDDTGAGFDDFSAIWGDKYNYLTKLQLYLRGRYEALFADFSLRENTVNATSVRLDKHWTDFTYVDTKDLSEIAKDILLPGNEY